MTIILTSQRLALCLAAAPDGARQWHWPSLSNPPSFSPLKLHNANVRQPHIFFLSSIWHQSFIFCKGWFRKDALRGFLYIWKGLHMFSLVFCEKSRFHYIWCAALGNSSQKTCTLLSSWREWQLYQTLTGSLNEIIVLRFLFQVIFLVLPFSLFVQECGILNISTYFWRALIISEGISSLFYKLQ